MQATETEARKGKCYVVMGLGKKTDFESGRTLDLDKTYRNIIKPAVTAAGLECLRADEIPHKGLIDVPMYEHLLNAEFVIADLSTSNKNAFYELGVRHALRPHTTIVICEDGAKSFPFDINHVVIRQYHHPGEAIEYEEVMRFRDLLTQAIVELISREPRPTDSPVYTFLNGLTPPALESARHGVAEARAAASPTPADGVQQSELMEQADEAQKAGDFETARALLQRVREAAREQNPDAPGDPYVIQRLALVTYKSKVPTPEAALEEARDLLLTLDPATTNDPETLTLWGDVHERLWEETKERAHLDEAVRGYERGFYLRNDHSSGLHYAFLLNLRAAHAATPAEAIADFVRAEAVRREIIRISEPRLSDAALPAADRYGLLAALAEAYSGSGEPGRAERFYSDMQTNPPLTEVAAPLQRRKRLEPLLADSPLKYLMTDTA